MFKFKVVPENHITSFYYVENGVTKVGSYVSGEIYSVPRSVFEANPIFEDRIKHGFIAEVKEEPKVKVVREEPMVVSVTAEEPAEEEVKEVRRRGKKKQEAAE